MGAGAMERLAAQYGGAPAAETPAAPTAPVGSAMDALAAKYGAPAPVLRMPARVAADASRVALPTPAAPAPVSPDVVRAVTPRATIGGVGLGDVARQRVVRGLQRGDEMEAGRVNLGEALMGAAAAFAPHPIAGETSEALVARLNAAAEPPPAPTRLRAPKVAPPEMSAPEMSAPEMSGVAPEAPAPPAATPPVAPAPPPPEPESIRSAAVRTPDGKVHEDAIHVLAIDKANAAGSSTHGGFESGFVTSAGRFVDRAEAARIAEGRGQLRAPVDPSVGLDSKDLGAQGAGTPPRVVAPPPPPPAPTTPEPPADAATPEPAAPVAPPVTAPAAPVAPAPDAKDVATAGGAERFAGLPIPAHVARALRTTYRAALVTPYADIEGEAPALVDALHKAGASTQRATHIGERRTAQVLEGLTPEQRTHFGRQLVLDNLTDRAAQRTQEAADARAQHQAATKDDLTAGIQGRLAQMEARGARLGGKAKYAIQAEADQIRQDLGAAATKPALQALADRIFAQPLQEAADRFTAHADALRPQVPADVPRQPWFQEALAKHREYVEGPLTGAALASGVDPSALRSPTSAYLRLVSEDRLNDAEIRRAMDATGAATPGALAPRGRLARALIGERPELARLFPQGASNLRVGPLKPNAGYPGEALPARPGAVGRTGSARQAQGTARGYVTEYERVVALDARDKAVKAARNDVYRAVVRAGRPLDDGEAPAPGKKALAFDDQGGLVTGDRGVQRVEVSPAVARAVRRFHQELEGPSPTSATAALRRTTGALTQAQISGMPVEATSHANTLASIVASVPGEKDVAGKALAAVPYVGAKAAAIRELYGVDFRDPATRALEHRLADIGALRIEGTPRGGALNTAHHWLFGPEGVDVRGRLVLARKYLARDPHASDDALREFITSKLGNYVRANSGALVNGLQDSGLSAFARFQAARIPGSVRATFGASGLPATGAAQKAGDVANTLWRGPLGYLVGAQLLNQALVGHGLRGNERGHGLDMQLGWGGKGAYIVDGHVVRLTDDEAQQMGTRARPLFIPAAVANPVVATGLRVTGARDVLFSDRKGPGKAADVVRDAANTALGTLSPAARFAVTAATGRAPYLNADGTLLQQTPVRFDKDKELADRLGAALTNANPALHAFAGAGGEGDGRSLGGALARDGRPLGGPAAVAARAAEFLMPRLLVPGVGGVQNDLSAAARDEREFRDAMAGYSARVRRATGPAQVADIIAEARADAERAGVNADAVELALTKAANAPSLGQSPKRLRALERATQRHRADPP